MTKTTITPGPGQINTATISASPHGGRQVLHTPDSRTWIFDVEVNGVNFDVVCYLSATGTLIFDREVVASAVTTAPTALSAAFDDQGRPAVSFSRPGTNVIKTYRREADVWTAKNDRTASVQNTQCFALLCTADGYGHLLIGDWTGTNQKILHYKSNSTAWNGTWAVQATVEQTTFTTTENVALRRLAACVDRAGQFHLMYHQTDTNRSAIRYSVWNTSSWSAPVDLYDTSGWGNADSHSEQYTLAVDKNGVPHVAFIHTMQHSFSRVKGCWYTNRLAGTWQSPVMIHPNVNADQARPSISILDDGRAQIAWISKGLYAPLEAGQITLAHGSLAGFTSIALDRDILATQVQEQAQIAFAWVPGGHGYAVAGYFVSCLDDKLMSVRIFASTEVAWHGEPDVEQSRLHFDSLSPRLEFAFAPQNTGSARNFGQVVAITRIKQIDLVQVRQFADGVRMNQGRNTRRFTQSVSLAGTVRNIFFTQSRNFASFGDRVDPMTCDAPASFVPSPPIAANQGDVRSVIFLGPLDTPSVSISFPCPKYEDQRAIDDRVVTQRSRSGEVHQFVKPGPKYSLQVQFDGLSRKKVIEWQAFLVATRGHRLRYIDHEGRSWAVHVAQTPSTPTQASPTFGGELAVSLEGDPIT